MSTVSSSTVDITTTAVAETDFVEAQFSQILRMFVFALTTFAALLGNTVVCKAVCEIRSSAKPMSYHLVTNVAVAEIINTLCLPFMFVYQYQQSWPFGEIGCRLVFPLQVASMFVVTNTLAAIAVYRYYFIVDQPLTRLSSRTVKTILFVLWAIPFLFCLPLVMYHTQFFHGDDVYCVLIFPGDDFVKWKFGKISNSYNIARFIFNFIVPCLVMILAYGGLAWKLRRHIRRTREMSGIELSQVSTVQTQPPDDETSSKCEEVVISPQDTAQQEQRRGSLRVIEQEHDLIRMFYLVIIIFIVLYMPYQLLYMYSHFLATSYPNDYIFLYLDLLSNLPSALHPLCYGTISSFYARSFSRLVLCKKNTSGL